MSEITVKDLNALIEKMQSVWRDYEAKKAEAKVFTEEYEKLSAEAMVHLDTLGEDSYKCSAGTIYKINKLNVTLPKTDEEKAALFGHLKERGIFEKYATVNFQSLNSLWNSDYEAAKEDGRALEFKMPGVGEPTLRTTIGLRNPT